MAFRPARPRLARLLERGLLLGLAVFLLGEDVEREPQTLSPPRPAPRRTPPPPDTRALLAFQGRYTILPPAPVLGLVFDECTGSVGLIHPFKKVVSGAIFVVAVYAPEPGAEAAARPAPPPAR